MAVYHKDHLLARWDSQGLVHWNVDTVGSLFLRNEVEPKKSLLESTGIWTTLSKKKRKSCSWQNKKIMVSVVQSLSRVWLFVTPWTAACQAPLSSTVFQSLLAFTYLDLVMLSNHLILSCPLLLLCSIFPSTRVFPNEWLFSSSGQITGVSALASVLPVIVQGWFPLGLTGLISLQSKGLSRVFSNNTVLANITL